MTKLVILRHGYSLYNKEHRFSGQYDVDLDDVGAEQAADAAAYVLANFKIDKIYSSDLIRAVRTVLPVAEALNVPIEKTAELREWNLGKWQQKTFDEVRAEFPDGFRVYKENVGYARPDGGESFEEFMQRCEAAILKIAAENDGKTVLIGTHGGVVRAFRCGLEKVPLEEVKNKMTPVPNASLCVVEVENGKGRFTEIGVYGYLKQKLTESAVV